MRSLSTWSAPVAITELWKSKTGTCSWWREWCHGFERYARALGLVVFQRFQVLQREIHLYLLSAEIASVGAVRGRANLTCVSGRCETELLHSSQVITTYPGCVLAGALNAFSQHVFDPGLCWMNISGLLPLSFTPMQRTCHEPEQCNPAKASFCLDAIAFGDARNVVSRVACSKQAMDRDRCEVPELRGNEAPLQ